MTDLVPTNGSAPVRSDLLAQSSPSDMLAQATQVANVLKDLVVRQGLVAKVSGKDHVKVEGWNVMGCMLGILSREKEVVEQEDGSFLATVELYSLKTGQVVGVGSALCGKDEARWGKADRFARRSMAITRATGKAYRLNFSWVMALAGFSPTPEEDMPDGPTNRPAKIYTGSEAQQNAIKKHLVFHKVPEEFWGEIDTRLRGRDVNELLNVITAVRSGMPADDLNMDEVFSK